MSTMPTQAVSSAKEAYTNAYPVRAGRELGRFEPAMSINAETTENTSARLCRVLPRVEVMGNLSGAKGRPRASPTMRGGRPADAPRPRTRIHIRGLGNAVNYFEMEESMAGCSVATKMPSESM